MNSGYEQTKIFKNPLMYKCLYDSEKPDREAIGVHGDIVLFVNGKFGLSRSWERVVKNPYKPHQKPPIKVGRVLKSRDGSIEGIVNLIRNTNSGYITLIGNMEFTNKELFNQFNIYSKELNDDDFITLK